LPEPLAARAHLELASEFFSSFYRSIVLPAEFAALRLKELLRGDIGFDKDLSLALQTRWRAFSSSGTATGPIPVIT
jgi:hypothetical protein